MKNLILAATALFVATSLSLSAQDGQTQATAKPATKEAHYKVKQKPTYPKELKGDRATTSAKKEHKAKLTRKQN